MSDPLVKMLNSVGYQAVFLPRSGVSPPELYTMSRSRLVRHGSLSAYIPEAGAVAVRTGTLGDWGGNLTTSKGAAASARFLERALNCLGLTSPGMNLESAAGRRLTFAFVDVTYRATDPTSLAPLLHTLPRTVFPSYLVDAEGLHVAYEYAFARKLRIVSGEGSTANFDLHSLLLSAGLSAGAKVEIESAQSLCIEANDRSQRAFAYKAGLLEWAQDEWRFHPEVIGRPSMGKQVATAFVPVPGVPLDVIDA